jgi:hypothetical protein
MSERRREQKITKEEREKKAQARVEALGRSLYARSGCRRDDAARRSRFVVVAAFTSPPSRAWSAQKYNIDRTSE